MPDLALKNIPEHVYRRLQEEAARHALAVEEEATQRIARSLGVPEFREEERNVEDLLRKAAEIRGDQKHDWLTPEFIRAAREEGRP
jgi:hypothetical protein